MSLALPELWPLLLLAPLLWGTLWALDRRRALRLARRLGPRVDALATEWDPRARALRRGLLAAGVLLAAVAALHPLWGESGGRIERGRLDIVLCLDVSRSMLAQDLPPDRLRRARAEARALAQRATGDRLALVAFAGDARALVPLTRDLRSFDELLDRADPLAVRLGGTDLGAALEKARELLGGRSGSVVLLTDGEDRDGRGLLAARVCRQHGITVHCAGFGTALGGKIPVDGGFVLDRAGREVVTALEPDSLQRIAEAGAGVFVDAARGAGALVALYENAILPAAEESRESKERRRRENRFQWPLGLAVLLWIAGLAVAERRTGR